jgi:hypothetical protein
MRASNSWPAKVLVGDHNMPGDRNAVEHLGGHDAFADVGGGQLPTDRHAI